MWLSALPFDPPNPPNAHHTTTRGSTGARTYELQRARDLSSGRWAAVCTGFHDCHLPEEGRVQDASLMRTPPANYFYRLVALNESGRSPPSPVWPLRLPAMDAGAPVDPGASSVSA